VGWFTTITSLQVETKALRNFEDAVIASKDLRRSLQAHRRFQLGSYMEQYGSGDGIVHWELLLNYGGVYQQPGQSQDLLSVQRAPDMSFKEGSVASSSRRFALIEINAHIEHEQLQLAISCHQDMRQQEKLEAWADLYQSWLPSALRQLEASPDRLTVSDLPLISTDQSELDELVQHITRETGVLPNNIEDVYPCTPMQEGILISNQKQAASYSNFTIWECTSPKATIPLSLDQMEAFWRLIADHHKILSTIFVDSPERGVYLQVVLQHGAA
jgi:hypothetical protein